MPKRLLFVVDPLRQLELQSEVGPEVTGNGFEIAETVGALAITESEPLCVLDVSVDSRFQWLVRRAPMRSLLACPVRALGEPLGAIVLSDSAVGAFSLDLARTLMAIADFAALAVRHARACAENLEHQRGLEALVDLRTREINKARAALSRHERTSAMGKLAASIAHEVNNPMSYLASNIERAVDYSREINACLPVLLELQKAAVELRESSDPCVERSKAIAIRANGLSAPDRLAATCADFDELLAETREGVNRIKRVGDDLRGFAQGITRAMEPVDINTLIETALHIAKAEAKEGIHFEFRPKILPGVQCQKYPITQVLVNLINNASESIEGDGEVRVSTSAPTGWVEVEISDDGSGIPQDQLDRIFEPFLTTKIGGSGLGLSISRDIVEAHCGSLEVRSSPEGSVFMMRLAVAGPIRDAAHSFRSAPSD